jgi:hypothetical protein
MSSNLNNIEPDVSVEPPKFDFVSEGSPEFIMKASTLWMIIKAILLVAIVTALISGTEFSWVVVAACVVLFGVTLWE